MIYLLKICWNIKTLQGRPTFFLLILSFSLSFFLFPSVLVSVMLLLLLVNRNQTLQNVLTTRSILWFQLHRNQDENNNKFYAFKIILLLYTNSW